MQNQDVRFWHNIKTGETVDCKYHYDCKIVEKKILSEGKMNFFRSGWCRLGVYHQIDKKIGIVECYSKKCLKKGIDFLLSKYKIDMLITETHDKNYSEMEIFKNPLAKGTENGI
jgi:hypothetical protein